MRMLDVERKQAVRALQLYLTSEEAVQLVEGLTRLLRDPEASEHEHLGIDLSREFSFSLVTPAKLARLERYTKLERQILSEQ